MDPRALLLELYAELDAELEALQPACRACGRCCDFRTHGNVLFATRLEREVLAMAGSAGEAAGGGAAAGNPRDPRVCPHLEENRCSGRKFRTLGCRTHFCEDPAAGRGRELYEKYRARLAVISREAGLEWDYRPLLGCPPGGVPGPE